MYTVNITCTAYARTFPDTQVPSLIPSWKIRKEQYSEQVMSTRSGAIHTCVSEFEVSLFIQIVSSVYNLPDEG